jgi:hypothetical protein
MMDCLSDEGLDASAGGGFGEAVRIALRDNDMSVVEQSVDCRGGEGLGHDLVEA